MEISSNRCKITNENLDIYFNTQPVKLRINGLKMCVAHNFNKEKADKKKNDILLNVKRETLRKFDELIKQRPAGDGIQSGSFLNLVANNIINNAEIQITNVEFVYINHVKWRY